MNHDSSDGISNRLFGQTRVLLVPQRDQGIDFDRPSRREVARDECDGEEQHGDAAESSGVGRTYAEEQS